MHDCSLDARVCGRVLGCKGHAPQSQIDPPSAVQNAFEPHTRYAHAVRTGLENCAWRQADVPNSTTARNLEPFLYKWVTDSLLNRFPKKGWRCDALCSHTFFGKSRFSLIARRREKNASVTSQQSA